jgi:prephenate dehydrogenase
VAPLDFGPVAVVGLGAIGGSVAKALLREGVRVCAYASNAPDVAAARRHGITVAADLATCVAEVSVVLIAVPLSAHAAVAAEVARAAPREATLLHTGGLQSASALAAAAPGNAADPEIARRAIGTHPLAGSHRAGFSAADPDLFDGCVVSTEDRAGGHARTVAERLWRAVGARRFEYRSAEEHDRLMTWVSHLPQLASIALAGTIANAGVPSSALGPGGRDVTRLAASSFAMWSGILVGARADAVRAAAALERSVGALRSALESADMDTVERMWSAARAWREATDHSDTQAEPRVGR